MSLLPENLALIERRWPAVFRLISSAEEPKSVFQETEGPQDTLVIDGIHLTSVYDRFREAELQASFVPQGSGETWVYGLGLGDVPRVLLARTRVKQLHVCILNPVVAKQSFKFYHHLDWLQDPRVELLAPDSNSDDIHFPFAAVAPCLQLADNRSARLRDLILLELATPFIHKKHSITNKALVERLTENTKFVRTDGDAASLFGTKKNSPIIVTAAGPTLSDHYTWLHRERHQFTVIAVDAALKPLTEAEIYPDIVLTIDMSLNSVRQFFQGISLEAFKNTPLVYFPAVHAEVLDLWPGPRLTAYPDSEAYHTLLKTYPKATLFSSGSVLHPAIDLAVQMGTGRIILFGADFSFPDGLSHVKGSAASRHVSENEYWVLNGEERRVATRPDFRGYLRDLEQYIALHRDIQFINGSKKGAYIKGTSYLKVSL